MIHSRGRRNAVLAIVCAAFSINLLCMSPAVASRTTVVSGNMTLQFNTSIPGDVLLTGGTLNLNGFSLFVAGSLYHAGGTLAVGGGSLSVEGDYRIQNPPFAEGTEFGESSGLLVMTDARDTVSVGGSFVTQSAADHRNRLTNGVLTVGGDFAQKAGSQFNFAASRDHQVVLSGERPQTVSFESPVQSGFGRFSAPMNNALFSTALRGWKLDEDLTINLKENFPLHRGFTGTLDLDGKSLVVKGDLLVEQQCTINISGGRLVVEGDFTQLHGTLNLGGGFLEVRGDYRLQSLLATSAGVLEGDSAGLFVMTNDDDTALIHGSFVTRSAADHRNRLTRGVLEVRGDFFQRVGSQFNFAASGTHRVVLSGSTEQTVVFEDPASSGFARCSVFNEQVVFPTALRGWKLEEDAVMNLSPEYPFHRGFVGTMDLDGRSLTITGDFALERAGNLNLSGGALVVQGSLLHLQGTLNLGGGSLSVEGDYIAGSPALLNGESLDSLSAGILVMTNDDDFAFVRGNFLTQSVSDHRNRLTRGVLAVGGDFIQRNGSPHNFSASGTHKVALFGGGERTVSFEASNSSRFQTLVLVDPSPGETDSVEQYPARIKVTASMRPLLVELEEGEEAAISSWIGSSEAPVVFRSLDQSIVSATARGEIRAVAPGRTALKIARSEEPDMFLFHPAVVRPSAETPPPATAEEERDVLEELLDLLPPLEMPAQP